MRKLITPVLGLALSGAVQAGDGVEGLPKEVIAARREARAIAASMAGAVVCAGAHSEAEYLEAANLAVLEGSGHRPDTTFSRDNFGKNTGKEAVWKTIGTNEVPSVSDARKRLHASLGFRASRHPLTYYPAIPEPPLGTKWLSLLAEAESIRNQVCPGNEDYVEDLFKAYREQYEHAMSVYSEVAAARVDDAILVNTSDEMYVDAMFLARTAKAYLEAFDRNFTAPARKPRIDIKDSDISKEAARILNDTNDIVGSQMDQMTALNKLDALSDEVSKLIEKVKNASAGKLSEDEIALVDLHFYIQSQMNAVYIKDQSVSPEVELGASIDGNAVDLRDEPVELTTVVRPPIQDLTSNLSSADVDLMLGAQAGSFHEEFRRAFVFEVVAEFDDKPHTNRRAFEDGFMRDFYGTLSSVTERAAWPRHSKKYYETRDGYVDGASYHPTPGVLDPNDDRVLSERMNVHDEGKSIPSLERFRSGDSLLKWFAHADRSGDAEYMVPYACMVGGPQPPRTKRGLKYCAEVSMAIAGCVFNDFSDLHGGSNKPGMPYMSEADCRSTFGLTLNEDERGISSQALNEVGFEIFRRTAVLAAEHDGYNRGRARRDSSEFKRGLVQ